MLPPPRCLSGAVVDTPLRTLLYFTYPHTYYLRACRSPSWSRLSGPARHFLLEGLTMSAGSADAEPGTLASNEASVRRLLERERSLLIGAWRVGAAGVKTFPVVSPTVRKSSRTPPTPRRGRRAGRRERLTRLSRLVAQDTGRAGRACLRPDGRDRTAGPGLAVLDAIDCGAPVGIMALDVSVALGSRRRARGKPGGAPELHAVQVRNSDPVTSPFSLSRPAVASAAGWVEGEGRRDGRPATAR
jgi:hypothetical protein